jgi:hypothetical protein
MNYRKGELQAFVLVERLFDALERLELSKKISDTNIVLKLIKYDKIQDFIYGRER